MSLTNIINYQYRTQSADLVISDPTRPIQGLNLNADPSGQNWNIVVIGGNNVNIQNGATGTYAVASEYPGAPVVGNSYDPYTWELLAVPGGTFQIATNDGRFVWSLTGDQDYNPIVLQGTPYYGQDAQWIFEPAQ